MAWLLIAGGLARRARAEDHLALGVQYFLEPARSQRLHVIHPQLDLNIDAHRAVSFRVGYDADIVTGATPRTYGGGSSAADVVSAATAFSDNRHAFHAATELRLGRAAVGAGYTYAFENDYRSHVIEGGAKVDLWGKNTTFRIGYAHNFDSVCNVDNRGAAPLERRALGSSEGCFQQGQAGLITEPLAIDSYTAGLTQVFSPIVLGDVGVGFQVLDGFQSNPYRRVRLFQGTVEAQEAHPLLRQRVSVQGRVRVMIKKARAALGASGRFYWDTWGIKSATAELTWEQYLIPQLLVRLRGRFYQQTRALFYRDAGEALSYEAVGPVGQYFTGDREMSPLRDFLAGIKVSYLKAADERGRVLRVFDSIDVNVKLDMIAYQALTPLPPNLPRSDGAIDALILQAGVVSRW